MSIVAFDHYTVRASDLNASSRFYGEALGLRCIPRPGAEERARFVFAEDDPTPIIHLFQAEPTLQTIFARLTPPDVEAAEWATGRMHHIAFAARGLAALRTRLQEHGVAFRERSVANQGLQFIVVEDPDGVELELRFPLEELTAG